MKKILFITAFISFSAFVKLFATGSAVDTLIMNDGKIVTGIIDEKTLGAYLDMQRDLNAFDTRITAADGSEVKIANREIHYFLIDGVKYANVKGRTQNIFMKVLVEGKARVYELSGYMTFKQERYTRPDNRSPTGRSHYLPMTTHQNIEGAKQLYMPGQNVPYSANADYIKKHFAEIFADCQSLQDEAAKDSNFDYANLANIATLYNRCFPEFGVQGAEPKSNSKAH